MFQNNPISPCFIPPFGSNMSTRVIGGYRYSFNGKETDSETGLQDYGFRIYNPSLGKFLSVDPLSAEYPWNSTYAFAENDVIRCIDLDGAEKYDYKLTLTKQGEIEMTLLKTTDIIDKVIIGYNHIDANGFLISEPIYETRVNQRQDYTVNNRNASLSTIQELKGTKTPDQVILAGMNKITSDYASNGGQFSDNYNVAFGRFIFEQGFKNMGGCAEADFTTSATATWSILDNTTFSKGATLFHLYENFVRKNENTGYDKLLHFSKSAQLTIKYGANTSGFLGTMKESKDWFTGKFGHGVGWDNTDMKANQDGINYGKTVNKSCKDETGEFCK